MFTGIIEEIGSICSLSRFGEGFEIGISAEKIVEDLKIGDSVAINGVCQTVISKSNNSFHVQAVEETLKKTTLGTLKLSSPVNLEAALTPVSRLGGHIMQGHVDCTGEILRIVPLSASRQIYISFDRKYEKYLIRSGSIAVDGISLTVASVPDAGQFMLSVIPHTIANTTLKNSVPSQKVNLEFDIVGKYIEHLFTTSFSNNHSKSSLENYIDQPSFL